MVAGNALSSDAVLARRLQAEELQALQGISVPLLNNNNQGVTPARIIAEQVRHENPTMELVKNILRMIELVATVAVVTATWEKGRDNKQCSLLRGWIIVFSSRLLFLLPLSMMSFRKRQRNEPTSSIDKAIMWITILQFLWFIIGQAWVYSDSCQEARALWIYVMVTVGLTFSLPIFFCIVFCICLPCLLLVLRVMKKPRTASSTAVRRLKTRKFVANSGDIELGDIQRCVICLQDYKQDEEIKTLPCGHEYHSTCVDPWLARHNRTCPTCRHDITKPFTEIPRQSEDIEEKTEVADEG